MYLLLLNIHNLVLLSLCQGLHHQQQRPPGVPLHLQIYCNERQTVKKNSMFIQEATTIALHRPFLHSACLP